MGKVIGYLMFLFCLGMLVFYVLDGDDWLQTKMEVMEVAE